MVMESNIRRKKEKLYPVYVIVMHSNNTLANIIKAATHATYSHVSISFDSSLDNMYSFGRKVAVDPLKGGFVKESIHSDYFIKKNMPYAVYVVPSTAEEIKRMKIRLKYFVKNTEKFSFDLLGLVTNYFRIDKNPEFKWFCSRFVAEILNSGKKEGEEYISKPSLFQPTDMTTTNFAYYIASGNLNSYDRKLVDKRTDRILRIVNRKSFSDDALRTVYEATNPDFLYALADKSNSLNLDDALLIHKAISLYKETLPAVECSIRLKEIQSDLNKNSDKAMSIYKKKLSKFVSESVITAASPIVQYTGQIKPQISVKAYKNAQKDVLEDELTDMLINGELSENIVTPIYDVSEALNLLSKDSISLENIYRIYQYENESNSKELMHSFLLESTDKNILSLDSEALESVMTNVVPWNPALNNDLIDKMLLNSDKLDSYIYTMNMHISEIKNNPINFPIESLRDFLTENKKYQGNDMISALFLSRCPKIDHYEFKIENILVAIDDESVIAPVVDVFDANRPYLLIMNKNGEIEEEPFN